MLTVITQAQRKDSPNITRAKVEVRGKRRSLPWEGCLGGYKRKESWIYLLRIISLWHIMWNWYHYVRLQKFTFGFSQAWILLGHSYNHKLKAFVKKPPLSMPEMNTDRFISASLQIICQKGSPPLHTLKWLQTTRIITTVAFGINVIDAAKSFSSLFWHPLSQNCRLSKKYLPEPTT